VCAPPGSFWQRNNAFVTDLRPATASISVCKLLICATMSGWTCQAGGLEHRPSARHDLVERGGPRSQGTGLDVPVAL
jgi:hypothetical protein